MSSTWDSLKHQNKSILVTGQTQYDLSSMCTESFDNKTSPLIRPLLLEANITYLDLAVSLIHYQDLFYVLKGGYISRSSGKKIVCELSHVSFFQNKYELNNKMTEIYDSCNMIGL